MNVRCAWTLGCPSEIKPFKDTHREDVHAGESYKNGFMELFPGVEVPEVVGVSCCAQFGVTRSKVRERPRSDYERYRKWLRETSLADDLSGRIMEYSWHSKLFLRAHTGSLVPNHIASDIQQRAGPLPNCARLLLQCLWSMRPDLRTPR